MEKLIILDRDGVINFDSDNYIKSIDEGQPEPGAIEAISLLTKAGFNIVVATNQSGISRGYYSHQTLNQMHNKLRSLCAETGGKISGIFYCPHGPDDGCECRKPKPGLFKKIEAFFSHPLNDTFAIGDSFRDLEAARLASANPILVLTGKGKKTKQNHATELDRHNIPVKHSLLDAAQYVIQCCK